MSSVQEVHQGGKRFTDESRGRQCTFMSLTALYEQREPAVEYKGDRLLLKALEHRLISDAESL